MRESKAEIRIKAARSPCRSLLQQHYLSDTPKRLLDAGARVITEDKASEAQPGPQQPSTASTMHHTFPPTREPARHWQRVRLDAFVRVQRFNGTVAEGHCVDASEEGFGIAIDMPLQVGEVVRLTVGRRNNAPAFQARVIWRQGSRVGLCCLHSAD